MIRLVMVAVAMLVALAIACSDEPPATTSSEATAPSASGSSAMPDRLAEERTPPTAPASRVGTSNTASLASLRYGDPLDLPENIAVIVETGCFQCDGPATGLLRVYRDPAGRLRSDILIQRPEGGLNNPYINSNAALPDASDLVVSICSRGYCGPANAITDDARTTVLRSRDGGVTWSELIQLDGAYDVVALAPGGVVVEGPFAPRDGTAPAAPMYRRYPGAQPVHPPAEARGGRPVTLPYGEVGWLTEDRQRLLRADGAAYLPLDLEPNARVGMIQPDSSGQRVLVGWTAGAPAQPPPSGAGQIGVFDRLGSRLRAFTSAGLIGPAVWLDDGWIIANAAVPVLRPTSASQSFTYLPVLVDLAAGEVRPIPDPFDNGGRNRIRAVLRGPFARVTPSGGCLNIRAEPRPDATVLNCAADGVLLRDTGETREAGGETWVRVVAPDRTEGWAAARFLER